MRAYFLLIAVILSVLFLGCTPSSEQVSDNELKLYWFIPDGMRADPDTFTIYKWAAEGKLPHIKEMMDNGAYGYSIPDFPSHTPTNFASLLTGAHPTVHGVADGPMHVEGFPLAFPSAKGFSSTAKKVAPIWTHLEHNGMNVALLSLPGSTPPELRKGITIRGRWGGWGADTHKVIYEPKEKLQERKYAGRGFRLFFLGSPLTKFVEKKNADGWNNPPTSFIPAKEATFNSHGLPIYAYIYDSTDDGEENYDRISFSLDKKEIFADLDQGGWSEWKTVSLQFKEVEFDSHIKLKIIKLWENGDFRVTVLYNNLNRLITEPSFVAEELTSNVGPLVDFADNWPPQLIYEEEDKDTFLEEARMSWEWHKNAASFILSHYKPDVFIQDIYTPNQMLESRWWHQHIDRGRKDYDRERADDAWEDILELYQGLDSILGAAMKKAGENTYIVLSSDHGVCSLKRLVKLNNLFAQKGWLKFTVDETTGEPIIDWENSQVIYLKMAHVYINPDGLGGNWNRGSGEEYEQLRDEVISVLKELEENEIKPVVNAIKWEDAPQFFNLPTDRVGDIVLEVAPGYFWFEEMDESLDIFVDPLTSGYKQTIDAKKNNCMWTPFMIMGPGVKENYVIEEPIRHVDQMPTILHLLGIEIPLHVEGAVLGELLG